MEGSECSVRNFTSSNEMGSLELLYAVTYRESLREKEEQEEDDSTNTWD